MTRLFETTTYIEDGETTLGIRSNKPFKIDGKNSFDDGDGYHVVYLTFSPNPLFSPNDGMPSSQISMLCFPIIKYNTFIVPQF